MESRGWRIPPCPAPRTRCHPPRRLPLRHPREPRRTLLPRPRLRRCPSWCWRPSLSKTTTTS
ncbi:hypothetical protein D7V88_32320 [Corallococcus terminator]|uniref:Uncharacterized protein n=1 Tax=Corallococcus terminator TaxID=2316733 RepID=A0A3A8HZR7_9BACT|nr:hypothetical protein D7V88_32320 [Corallococcus terminator]